MCFCLLRLHIAAQRALAHSTSTWLAKVSWNGPRYWSNYSLWPKYVSNLHIFASCPFISPSFRAQHMKKKTMFETRTKNQMRNQWFIGTTHSSQYGRYWRISRPKILRGSDLIGTAFVMWFGYLGTTISYYNTLYLLRYATRTCKSWHLNWHLKLNWPKILQKNQPLR